MKKNRSLIIMVVLILSLTSCSVNAENTKQKRQTVRSGNEKPDALVKESNNIMKLQIGKHRFTATMENNTSVDALNEMLKTGPVTIKMKDYGNMEKVGSLGKSLPRNDKQTTTDFGDLILYQGKHLVIYYDSNAWSFTRLGKIKDVSQKELKEVLGKGDVKVTLSLE